MLHINYLAVLVSGIAAMVIGAIWYGPLFGKAWLRGMGYNLSDSVQMDAMKKSAPAKYVQQFVGALIMAFVLAHILGWVLLLASFGNPDRSRVGISLFIAFLAWFGFVLPVKYADKLWARKSFAFVSIDLGNYLITLLVMALILGLWK